MRTAVFSQIGASLGLWQTLAIVPSPIDFPRMRFYQLWHDCAHHSAAHQWLRSLLTAASP